MATAALGVDSHHDAHAHGGSQSWIRRHILTPITR